MIPLLAIGGAAAVAGVGLSAAGEVQQSRAAKSQAESQAAILEFNARVAGREAASQEAAAAFAQKRQSKEAARTRSALLAGLGASGVVVSEGTPLMIEAAQAEELELENLLIGFEGRVGAERARSQAQLDRLQAQRFRQAGVSARQAGTIGAGATLLSGFGGLTLQGASFAKNSGDE